MWGLNNEIKDALTLSDNTPQQFQEFVVFLSWLENRIRIQEAEKKGKPEPYNPNTTPQPPHTTQTSSNTSCTYLSPLYFSAN
jgi:hypothetical protein